MCLYRHNTCFHILMTSTGWCHLVGRSMSKEQCLQLLAPLLTLIRAIAVSGPSMIYQLQSLYIIMYTFFIQNEEGNSGTVCLNFIAFSYRHYSSFALKKSKCCVWVHHVLWIDLEEWYLYNTCQYPAGHTRNTEHVGNIKVTPHFAIAGQVT